MKQLNLYYLGGGGGSVPDGRTVTPINDAVIWQKCAGISNPTYTSIGEILADSGMLQTLMASDNAVDYLVRCKAFMATRSLVPVMTSDNTPSGVAFADVYYPGYQAYRVFDNNASTDWVVAVSGAESAVNHYVGYDFETPTIVNKIFILPDEAGNTGSNGCRVKNYRIEASNDKVAWDILTSQTYTAANSAGETVTFTNNTAYRYYRCYVVDNYTTNYTIGIKTLTFYSPVGICDTADAMTAIGQNNYCANTLLADAEWLSAICDSVYKEDVLNTKQPIMTSNTTPSGTVSLEGTFANSTAYSLSGTSLANGNQTAVAPYAYVAVTGGTASRKGDIVVGGTGADVNFGIVYEFSSAKIYQVALSLSTNMTAANGYPAYGTVKISLRKASDQAWVEVYSKTYPSIGGSGQHDCTMSQFVDGKEYDAIKVEQVSSRGWDVAIGGIQYYGREDV